MDNKILWIPINNAFLCNNVFHVTNSYSHLWMEGNMYNNKPRSKQLCRTIFLSRNIKIKKIHTMDNTVLWGLIYQMVVPFILLLLLAQITFQIIIIEVNMNKTEQEFLQ